MKELGGLEFFLAGITVAIAIVVIWECIKPKLKEYLTKNENDIGAAYARGARDAKRAGDTKLDGIEAALEVIEAKYGVRVVIKKEKK